MSTETMPVGTGRTVADSLMGRMEGRALADSVDRQAWLEARASRVTATEAAKLRLGGVAARRDLLATKRAPQQEITGNRYMDRGHEREPVIAAWVAARFPGVRPNTVLFHAEQNPRHAATPDGYGVHRGEFVLLEIKTSKHDVDPDGAYFARAGYGLQVQWQMYVTGARRCLFVWEQHDDAWPDPQPLDLEPQCRWIDYDPAAVEAMLAQADLLLAELDHAAVSGPPEPAGFPGLYTEADVLALAVLDARVVEATAKADREAAWRRLLTLLAGAESFSHTGAARVTWTNEDRVEQAADTDAALAADGGAELWAAAQEAQAAWGAHLAGFRKERTVQVQKLTVTAPGKAGTR